MFSVVKEKGFQISPEVLAAIPLTSNLVCSCLLWCSNCVNVLFLYLCQLQESLRVNRISGWEKLCCSWCGYWCWWSYSLHQTRQEDFCISMPGQLPFFPQLFPTWNTCVCKDKHRIHLIPVSALCLLRKLPDALLLITFYLAFQHSFFPHHQADQFLLICSL